MSIIVILHTFLFKGKNLGSVKYFANLVEKEKILLLFKGKSKFKLPFFLMSEQILFYSTVGEIETCERQKAGS